MTTKIFALAKTFDRPLRFFITPGQASDIAAAPDLLSGQTAGAVLAYEAYYSDDFHERVAGMKARAVIPSKRNRKVFICMIPPSTSIGTGSNDASAASTISAASQHDMIDALSTSAESLISLPPWSGYAECRSGLGGSS